MYFPRRKIFSYIITVQLPTWSKTAVFSKLAFLFLCCKLTYTVRCGVFFSAFRVGSSLGSDSVCSCHDSSASLNLDHCHHFFLSFVTDSFEKYSPTPLLYSWCLTLSLSVSPWLGSDSTFSVRIFHRWCALYRLLRLWAPCVHLPLFGDTDFHHLWRWFLYFVIMVSFLIRSL